MALSEQFDNKVMRWSRGRYFTSLFLLFFLAIVVRCLFLQHFPMQIHNDESAAVANTISQFEKGENPWPLWGKGPFGHPNLGYWLSALPSRIAGEATLWTGRIASAISGVLSLILFAAFMRISFGDRASLLFLLFAAPFHLHVHYSRTAFTYIHALLLFALVSLMMARAVKNNTLMAWILLGGAVGLALLVYPATHILPVALAISLVCGSSLPPAANRSVLSRWPYLIKVAMLSLVGLLITFGPQVIYSYQHGYTSRLGQTFIFQPHNIKHLTPLIRVANPTSFDVATFGFWNTLRFFYQRDSAEQYNFVDAPLGLWFGVLAILGLVVLIRAATTRHTISIYMLASGLLTLGASALLVEGPFSPHLLLFAILMPVSCALGWQWLLDAVGRGRGQALKFLVTVLLGFYWMHWNWKYYNRVVDPYRSRITQAQTWLLNLPIETGEVQHLVNFTTLNLGFGESYYPVIYPKARQTNISTSSMDQFKTFMGGVSCPCVVILKYAGIPEAQSALATIGKKMRSVGPANIDVGYAYVEEQSPGE